MTKPRSDKLNRLWPRVCRVTHPQTGERILRGYNRNGQALGDIPWPKAVACKTWWGRASREEWDAYVAAIHG